MVALVIILEPGLDFGVEGCTSAELDVGGTLGCLFTTRGLAATTLTSGG